MTTSKIKMKAKALREREKKLRTQLERSEQEIQNTANHVKKIALITGIVTLLGYWVYRVIFGNDSSEEVKVNKRKRINLGLNYGRLSNFFSRYILKFLREVLELDEEEKNEK